MQLYIAIYALSSSPVANLRKEVVATWLQLFMWQACGILCLNNPVKVDMDSLTEQGKGLFIKR